jgi:moderate conductance mechanosensitive channel
MDELFVYFRDLDAGARAASITALRVVLILAIAWLLQVVAGRLIRTFRAYMQRRAPDSDEVARMETLARVFRNAAAILITVVAGTLVLGEVGISVAPILATAGVAGVAIGFGAQSLIKDYFNGFFLLLDDQLREGDVVEIGGKGGLVEEVTLRYVRLRDFEGHVHFVPNGEIKIVTNRTRGYAREDLDEALEVMRAVGRALRAEPAWGERIAEDVEIIGVERLADSAVILRCRVKVIPAIQQWNIKREFLKRLKKAYDERGIEIPYPHVTVYPGQNKDGGAPALHLITQGP